MSFCFFKEKSLCLGTSYKIKDVFVRSSYYYFFGGARSEGFATLKSVSKLTFFDKIEHAKSVGFRFYSAI